MQRPVSVIRRGLRSVRGGMKVYEAAVMRKEAKREFFRPQNHRSTSDTMNSASCTGTITSVGASVFDSKHDLMQGGSNISPMRFNIAIGAVLCWSVSGISMIGYRHLYLFVIRFSYAGVYVAASTAVTIRSSIQTTANPS